MGSLPRFSRENVELLSTSLLSRGSRPFLPLLFLPPAAESLGVGQWRDQSQTGQMVLEFLVLTG